jgi:hypothetical protein
MIPSFFAFGSNVMVLILPPALCICLPWRENDDDIAGLPFARNGAGFFAGRLLGPSPLRGAGTAGLGLLPGRRDGGLLCSFFFIIFY